MPALKETRPPSIIRPGLQAVITAAVRFVQCYAARCCPFAAADEKTDIVEPAEGIDSVTDTAAEDAAFSVGIFPCQRNVRVDARKLVLVTVRDMNGMIWEWNTTNWGPEPKKPDYPYPYNASDGRENSRHAADDVRRVMRGGSFGSTADHATATYRGHLEPIGFWRGDGFRIVVSETEHE